MKGVEKHKLPVTSKSGDVRYGQGLRRPTRSAYLSVYLRGAERVDLTGPHQQENPAHPREVTGVSQVTVPVTLQCLQVLSHTTLCF